MYNFLGINWRLRFKNFYFWVGTIFSLMVTSGFTPTHFTTWSSVKVGLILFLSNPYRIGSFISLVLLVAYDPTTISLKDSDAVLKRTQQK